MPHYLGWGNILYCLMDHRILLTYMYIGTLLDRSASTPSPHPTTGEPWWAIVSHAGHMSYIVTLSMHCHWVCKQMSIPIVLCTSQPRIFVSFVIMTLVTTFIVFRESSWCTTSQARSPLTTSPNGYRILKWYNSQSQFLNCDSLYCEYPSIQVMCLHNTLDISRIWSPIKSHEPLVTGR